MARPTPADIAPRRPGIARWLPVAFAPALALLACADAAPTPNDRNLIVGAAVVAGGWAVFAAQAARPAGPLIALHLLALGWLWVVIKPAAAATPALHMAQAVLLFVPTVLFGLRLLEASGAAELRRADLAARRVRRRRDWPADPLRVRTLPEVMELRAASRAEPASALALLSEPTPAVRLAALAALEGRAEWRASQVSLLLNVFRTDPGPAVRAAVLAVLAPCDDRDVIDALAHALEDPSAEVRRAAAAALLAGHPKRWGWVREAVHASLANPLFAADGPLLPGGGLTPVAALDVLAWVAEGGTVAVRATLTLVAHYRRAVQSGADPALVAELRKQAADDRTPAVYRVELAHLLHEARLLDEDLLLVLLEETVPTPARLLAAEALLQEKKSPRAAAAVLREIGRQPNRELAVAAAAVVQKCLGVDMGLVLGQPPPELHTRAAADAARRVMEWANRPEPEPPAEGGPAPAQRPEPGSGVMLW